MLCVIKDGSQFYFVYDRVQNELFPWAEIDLIGKKCSMEKIKVNKNYFLFFFSKTTGNISPYIVLIRFT